MQANAPATSGRTDLDPLLHGTLHDLVKVNLALFRQTEVLNNKVDFIISLLTREESRKAEEAASMAGDYN